MTRRGTIAAGMAVAAIAFAGLATFEGRASGYVRKRTDEGLAEYWAQSCLAVTVYMNGFGGMSRDAVAKSVAAAAHAWGPNAVSCPLGGNPYLEVLTSIVDDDSAAARIANDGRNVFTFVREGWADTRPFNALALTATWHRPDGRIVDGDIEINADEFFGISWANLDPGAGGAGNGLQTADLQNAVTHEMGHLLGFDHTCIHLDEEPAFDDQGQPVPSCDDASEEIRQTVMYNGILMDGETSKRFLSADEVRAVCEVYPRASDPRTCTLDLPNDGCACSAAAHRPGAGILLVAAGLLVALNRPRDRRAARARTARPGSGWEEPPRRAPSS